MKRVFVLVLTTALFIANCAYAEYSADDYAWLDDLTINQLKALDAEIHKRLPEEPANDASNNETDSNPLLGLLFGNNSAEEGVESQTLAVGEKTVTESAEFEILGISVLRVKDHGPSGWITVSGHDVREKFYIDSDCSLLQIFYRVKNKSPKSKWFWPSSLQAVIHWNEYEFVLLGARPMGDLQSTHTKNYVAVAEIPNSILKGGCDDIVIEIGFKESFSTFSNIKQADHRYIVHTSYSGTK